MRFDIDDYLSKVAPLDDSDIDYDVFRAQPLDEPSLRTLRYMHDVEHHTTCYLRDLLMTSAHEDPAITSFLAMWAFEEFWHGEAIGKVLAAHGEPQGRERIALARRRIGRERLTTLGMMALSTVNDHVVAMAMTWGAINEWTTQAGYVRLAATAQHDELGKLVLRIARQEGRHIDFYVSQAEQRLADRGAQVWTRRALRYKWRPVGSGVMPSAETDHLIRTLFGDEDGRSMARRIDRRIDRLPGLAGLGLISGVRASALRSAA